SVRLYKTRSKASEACKKNKIAINGSEAKASKIVAVNDQIMVKKSGIKYEYKVLDIATKRMGAKLVPDFILEITSLEEKEKLKLQQLAQKTYRDKGAGRPTKKDRRDLDGFMD
ncbi:S4 domain-containing protein, partial [Flavobacteriales bacterium]|nr:S4 domain-containing protein [Flavobacteriales bacterium]